MTHTQAPEEHTSQPFPGMILWLWRWFWRVTLVVSLAYAWYCFYVPANTIAWANNYTSAQKQAAQSDKPIILYFTAKWCVPCRIMKRQVWADEQVAVSVNKQFVPVVIDVDNPDDDAVLARYHVVGAPVTIVTDPHGNVLQWQDGGMGKADFLEFLGRLNPSDTAPSPAVAILARESAVFVLLSVLDRAIWGRRGVSLYGRRTITDGSRGIPATFYKV